MGDAQQPVEFGPGQRRCDPHRFADARYEVEIVVLEMFVAVESEPDGADETVARECNFIILLSGKTSKNIKFLPEVP